jgi:hypothetical protein
MIPEPYNKYSFRANISVFGQTEINIKGCEHIDNKCFLRSIDVFDFENMEYKKINICNEKIRLLYHYNNHNFYTIDELYYDLISQHIKIYKSKHCNYDYKGYFTWIPVNNSLKIYHKLSIVDYINVIHKQLNSINDEKKVYYLIEHFFEQFDSFLLFRKLKKYSNIYKKYLELKKAKSNRDYSNFLILLNDFFIILLNTKN